MKDEIKEIFSYFIKYMSIKDCMKITKVEDYIINLQQENEYLKLNNPEMNIEHFRIINENKRKIDNLRKQNKELEEINKDHQRMNIELREENKRLKRYLDDKMEDLQNIYTHYIRLQNTYDDLYDKYIDIAEGRNENE